MVRNVVSIILCAVACLGSEKTSDESLFLEKILIRGNIEESSADLSGEAGFIELEADLMVSFSVTETLNLRLKTLSNESRRIVLKVKAKESFSRLAHHFENDREVSFVIFYENSDSNQNIIKEFSFVLDEDYFEVRNKLLGKAVGAD
ncbi:hypothetical protein [Pelagicoccus sp. SDUM812005]|uniref:hypothetical protein n=1 Tax=Pelagicoccus sp. SDUM812005 TaxID=3041257 RepID=UPI00280E9A76|nr:hypothetical protein [Pelagicoccus sp. SDUM812005]MDQ8182219.1 hypothetical protein [Pelagicoccus sp. SDUM812005]